jgi:hypothetical protein
MTAGLVFEFVVAGTALVGWFLLLGTIVVVTRPRDVRPGPPTQDLGGSEPPAVVSLLVNQWEVTEDAAESTLIDLAARKYLEFRQPGNDPMQTTIHVRPSGGQGVLHPYERRVLDRISGLAVNGTVPLAALTFRDPDQASTWAKRLRAEVVADARTRGLSRSRYGGLPRSILAAGAGAAAVAVALAVAHHAVSDHGDIRGVLGAGIITFGVLSSLTGALRGERDTPQGREVAARWLGVRAYLRGDESFAELPPAAVTVWDRYLSYGDAVGATRVCAAVIDLGMGNRRRVWSSYGGTWHRVRVRYPHFWGRYGKTAPGLITWSLVCIGLGFLLVRYRPVAVDRVPGGYGDLAGLVIGALGLYLLGRGGYRLVRTVFDLAAPATVTGEVLWEEVWRSNAGGENSPPTPWLYYLAVDDGQDDRTTAWGLPSNLYSAYHVGDVVRLTVRRWTRRVTALDVVQRGRRVSTGASYGNDDNTESMVQAAMGLRVDPTGPGSAGGAGPALLAGLMSAPAVAADRLLTADEVGRALGRPVTVSQTGGVAGPVSMAGYSTVDGHRAVYVTVTGGLPGKLAVRTRRGHPALPGIGDEAYAGDNWAIARRGDTVVGIQLHGGAAGTDPRNVYWLLATAVGRLPA